MCGIAGTWGNFLPSQNLVSNCIDALKHRGPDQQGYRVFHHDSNKETSLIFARLAIIDLSENSNQPMNFENLWLIFNGEIYNYKELRVELENLGIKFRTQSDTEVLLKGIKVFGWSFLEKIQGMWAFAIYDQNLGRLSLCRDRFGEKPLKYVKKSDGVIFASEIRALKELSGLRLSPNYDHITRFLVNGYKSLYKTNETFFEEVVDVEPSSLMHFDVDGSTTISKYWKPNIEIDNSIDFTQAVIQAKDKLIRSVELTLRSDVPIAFSLSGGIDSVGLASIARREFNIEIHGFTVRNTDSRYEEFDIVQKVRQELGGGNYFTVELSTTRFFENLNEVTKNRQSPVLTLSSFAQNMMMKSIAKNGYKVVIGGIGADEIYTGYYDHHLFYLSELKNNERQKAIDNWLERVKPYVQNPHLKNFEIFIKDPEFREHIFLNHSLHATFMNKYWSENFTEIKFHKSNLRNRMLNELLVEAVPVLLHEEDANAMNYSVENRSPYLDRDLVNYLGSVPTENLIKNGYAKAILRNCLKGIAPDYVLNNPKKTGFNIPIESFIDFENKESWKGLLSESPIFNIVNKNAIDNLMTKKGLTNSESKFLFSFISCKYFLESQE
jgi:asparagine synthase (glutamine-hydrolysing)